MKKQIAIALVVFAALIVAAVFMVKNGPRPALRPREDANRNVSAIQAVPISFSPVIHGYGEARPDRTWSAVTQVGGKITEINPKLQNGSFLKQGDIIAKIDDTEYLLAIDKANADIAKIQADLDQLATRSQNLQAQKNILDRMLTLNRRNLDRNRQLRKDGGDITDQALEQEELTVLQQENTVASLAAEIALIPHQKAAYQAQLNAAQASLRQAELNVRYASLTAPFDGRVTDATAQLHQFAPAGTTLCKLDSIAMAEVQASFAPELLAILPPTPPAAKTDAVNDAKAAHTPLLPTLTFTVSTADQLTFSWPARFLRYAETVDPNTRMVNMVLGIDKPYAHTPGDTPHLPLTRGLFCKATITGPKRDEIVLPRQVIHDNTVYILKDGKLDIRPVTVKYNLGVYAIIASGVSSGDIVITSDLVPAIQGMALQATCDDSYPATATSALAH